MSRNKAPNPAHFRPLLRPSPPYIEHMDSPAPQLLSRASTALALTLLSALAAAQGGAQGASQGAAPGAPAAVGLQAQVEGLLHQQPLPQGSDAAARNRTPWRVEVALGQLDPRLKLAPCDKVKAYVPDGTALWGRARVGLRCEQGPVRWNVYWPVTVKVWGQALVAAVPLRPGNIVNQADVVLAEVDLAASGSPALVQANEIVGRTVVKAVSAGQSLRQDDVKSRRWFAAGDPVRLTVRGPGFQVGSEAVALGHGDEGRCTRVRTEAGRVLCAQPVGDRLVEVTL